MKITGIICEYNPLHLGHKKQLDLIRNSQGADSGIVCLMSGNFVQRGMPAIFDKSARAKAAVLCGADLVLELPVTAALSSAEGFAAGGVSILGKFCSTLCFGAETAQHEALLDTAKALQSDAFSVALRSELDKGLSFPAARQAALQSIGGDADLLTLPNNILAVEYCKAILQQKSTMQPLPILRQGNYHDVTADAENPSATALRQLIESKHDYSGYVPKEAVVCFENETIHTRTAGERAILARLRCMTDEEFKALPYGSEGLWRKLMHAARSEATLEDIINATKSKRYTRTRLDRMIMCAFLSLTQSDLSTPAPYVRVLAFNDRGREILKTARQTGEFINIGQTVAHPYQQIENRCGDLYSLFCKGIVEHPNAEKRQRIFHK